MTHVKILLADDHKIVRQGVRALLEAQPGFEVVGEADDGKQALEMIEALSPDIALLDVMTPNMNGIEAAKLARARGSRAKFIFLSMHANPVYAVRALQSGALGYVLKDSDFHEILQAIENALQGRRYLSPAIADETLDILLSADASLDDSLERLSAREREILQLVAEGNTNAAIAQKLTISVRTVESHRANIMRKLRLNSHAELVKYAVNQGLAAA